MNPCLAIMLVGFSLACVYKLFFEKNFPILKYDEGGEVNDTNVDPHA